MSLGAPFPKEFKWVRQAGIDELTKEQADDLVRRILEQGEVQSQPEQEQTAQNQGGPQPDAGTAPSAPSNAGTVPDSAFSNDIRSTEAAGESEVAAAEEHPKAVESQPLPSTPPKPELVAQDPMADAEFVRVKGGCFEMGCGLEGSECSDNSKPVHEVCVREFYIGKYEVTQEEWEKVMGNNPSALKQGGDYPVESVSWNDTQGFIKKLNSMASRQYRLPTEAEWEYACRSRGKKEGYCGGDNVQTLAWEEGNSGAKTHARGTKAPNGLGIYDMSGNVWEWCADRYDKDYYRHSPRDNPRGPSSGSARVLRGGGWLNGSKDAQATNRSWDSPSSRYGTLGFRLAFTPSQDRGQDKIGQDRVNKAGQVDFRNNKSVGGDTPRSANQDQSRPTKAEDSAANEIKGQEAQTAERDAPEKQERQIHLPEGMDFRSGQGLHASEFSKDGRVTAWTTDEPSKTANQDQSNPPKVEDSAANEIKGQEAQTAARDSSEKQESQLPCDIASILPDAKPVPQQLQEDIWRNLKLFIRKEISDIFFQDLHGDTQIKGITTPFKVVGHEIRIALGAVVEMKNGKRFFYTDKGWLPMKKQSRALDECLQQLREHSKEGL